MLTYYMIKLQNLITKKRVAWYFLNSIQENLILSSASLSHKRIKMKSDKGILMENQQITMQCTGIRKCRADVIFCR